MLLLLDAQETLQGLLASGDCCCGKRKSCLISDVPCTHDFMQSAKLKHVQHQVQTMTKERETLMQTIQGLEARIKQGWHTCVVFLQTMAAFQCPPSQTS